MRCMQFTAVLRHERLAGHIPCDVIDWIEPRNNKPSRSEVIRRSVALGRTLTDSLAAVVESHIQASFKCRIRALPPQL